MYCNPISEKKSAARHHLFPSCFLLVKKKKEKHCVLPQESMLQRGHTGGHGSCRQLCSFLLCGPINLILKSLIIRETRKGTQGIFANIARRKALNMLYLGFFNSARNVSHHKSINMYPQGCVRISQYRLPRRGPDLRYKHNNMLMNF